MLLEKLNATVPGFAMTYPTCYLCGHSMPPGEDISDDHAIPRLLIARKQPRARGFDYGHTLPAHASCNSGFWPESYCSKALRVLSALNDDECFFELPIVTGSSITAMGINPACFPDFTPRDLEFFRIIDGRNLDVDELSTPAFFAERKPSNLERDAVSVALSVLTKSAAALLVSRKLSSLPSVWRVLAVPYLSPENPGLEMLFGQEKPFDIGVEVRLRESADGDWLAAYYARPLLLYLFFQLSTTDLLWTEMSRRFRAAGADCLAFEGHCLNDLINYAWSLDHS